MPARTGHTLSTLLALGLFAATLAGCGTQAPGAEPTSEPSGSPSASGTPSPTSSPTTAPDRPGIVALSDDGGLGTPGYWNVRLDGGWEPVVLDQEGRNQIKNPKNGCMFTSQQSQDPAASGSDAVLSRSLAESQAKALAQQAGTTASSVSTIVVPRGTLTTQGGVEMASARVAYTREDTGQEVTSQIAARRFISTHTVMIAVLNCPTRQIPTAATAEKEFTARARITTQ